MDNRSLTKFLTSPLTKLTWTQGPLLQHCKGLEVSQSRNVNSNTLFMGDTISKNLSLGQQKVAKGLASVYTSSFSTTANYNSFWNKLTSNDQRPFQVPAQLYANKTENEPLLEEGVGWAGQPIVRRIHPILPEVNGDLSDIFTAVKKMPGSSKTQEDSMLSSEIKSFNETKEKVNLNTDNFKEKEIKTKNVHSDKGSIVNSNKRQEHLEDKSFITNRDAISFIDENIKSSVCKSVYAKEPVNDLPLKQIKSKVIVGEKEHVMSKVGLVIKKDKHSKQFKNINLKPELFILKQKKQKRKKTKVCSSKAGIQLMSKKKIKKGKKKIVSGFSVSKKSPLRPNLNLTLSHANNQPIAKNVMLMENRQIKTYSQANQAQVKVSIKEKTTTAMIAVKKSKKKGFEYDEKYPDPCKCPEILDVKTRSPTKICGEAAGAKEKKRKIERKGKMCPIEQKVQHRRRTFVCQSAKFAKGKRKRQLPKCEKPEKKVAPRVFVCPPVIDELKEGEKKICLKEVEEVKIRKRTKVCKPIIVHVKEEAAAVIEKKVCVEKKVQKTISRHTVICTSPERTDSKKDSKR